MAFTDPSTASPNLPEAMGESEEFLQFQENLSRAARVNRPVLLIGERGTGKEIAAARLHFLSPRWEGPLITLNCAALAPSLIESELFGHEEGAFTGANRRKTGRFEAADGGTLFLDELGMIPLEVQEKILRVVEYGIFERVGGSTPIRVDVRIMGATNANLVEMAEKGQFKQDLLDRLSFEVLFLPPLRVREGDIILLANHFAVRMTQELGLDGVPSFSETAQEKLIDYPWPGNVRELKNVVERAVYSAGEQVIESISFDPFSPPGWAELEEKKQSDPTILEKPGESVLPSYEDALNRFEINLLVRSLRQARNNQKKAAGLLSMSYHQFRWLLRKHPDVQER
jgi:psp operon transcriptional activator